MSEQPETRDDLDDPQLARWYREAGGPEPAEATDRAILAAARREVQARPSLAGPGVRQWRVPLAMAAVLVLSVTVVMLVREEGGGTLDDARSVPPPAATTLDGTGVKPAPATSQQSDPAPSDPPGTAPRGSAKEQAQLAKPGPAPEPVRAPAPEPRPTTGAGDAPLLGQGEPQRSPEHRVPEPLQTMPGLAAPGRLDSSARETAKSAEDSAAATRPESQRSEMRRDAAPTASPVPAAPPASAAPRAAQAPAGPAVDLVQVVKGLDGQPPERWLAKIEELRRDGHIREADELLAVFSRRFPEHPRPGPR